MAQSNNEKKKKDTTPLPCSVADLRVRCSLTPPAGTRPRWLRFTPREPGLSPQAQVALLAGMEQYLSKRGGLPHLFALASPPASTAPPLEAPAEPGARAALMASHRGDWTLVVGIIDEEDARYRPGVPRRRSHAYKLVGDQAARLGLHMEGTLGRTWGLDLFERRADLD